MADEETKKDFNFKELSEYITRLSITLEVNSKGLIKYNDLSRLKDLAQLGSFLCIAESLERLETLIENEFKTTRTELNQTLNQIWAELASRPEKEE